MIFYLGIHEPAWMPRTSAPLFVSRRRLARRTSMPRAAGRWALDSGGFTELSMGGSWSVSARQYASEATRYQAEIGGLDWAAPQDWMCEPSILRRTGLDVAEHQRRSIDSAVELRSLAPWVPWVPVLQGWTISDYLRHVEAYEARGFDLRTEPIVAVGSVCRRGSQSEVARILRTLSDLGLRLHAFGVKLSAVGEVGEIIVSSDSMAWSYRARRSPPMPGHRHRSCANCLDFALMWREMVLARTTRQMELFRRSDEAGRPAEEQEDQCS
jgi:hypothetical protein